MVRVLECPASLAISSTSVPLADSRDTNVREFLWRPPSAQACGIGDVPELAPDVRCIKRRPGPRAEHQALILPRAARREPVGGLHFAVRAERIDARLGQGEGPA